MAFIASPIQTTVRAPTLLSRCAASVNEALKGLGYGLRRSAIDHSRACLSGAIAAGPAARGFHGDRDPDLGMSGRGRGCCLRLAPRAHFAALEVRARCGPSEARSRYFLLEQPEPDPPLALPKPNGFHRVMGMAGGR